MERLVIYGSEVFVGELKKAYELEEMIRPIGRPKTEPRQKLEPFPFTLHP